MVHHQLREPRRQKSKSSSNSFSPTRLIVELELFWALQRDGEQKLGLYFWYRGPLTLTPVSLAPTPQNIRFPSLVSAPSPLSWERKRWWWWHPLFQTTNGGWQISKERPTDPPKKEEKKRFGQKRGEIEPNRRLPSAVGDLYRKLFCLLLLLLLLFDQNSTVCKVKKSELKVSFLLDLSLKIKICLGKTLVFS